MAIVSPEAAVRRCRSPAGAGSLVANVTVRADMTNTLSTADVARLMQNPSADMRATTAAKIAKGFNDFELGPRERGIAEEIFRVLVKDAEAVVRESLSAHLKACPDLPHDVALALAHDIDSVSLPMLKSSDVLRDEDLIHILRNSEGAKQEAIAQRPSVSSSVADAVVDTGNGSAVARLMSNEGADISEGTFERVFEDYADSEAVSNSLMNRVDLPPEISDRLVNALSDKLQEVLLSKHDVPADQFSKLIVQARERATVTLLKEGSSEEELQELIDKLCDGGRLTGSLVLRALCMGDMSFFELSMSRLCGIPVQNARILIHDQGELGLRSLYMKSGLPENLFPAFRAAVDVVDGSDYDGGVNDRRRYVSRTVERILTRFADPASRIEEDDLGFLIDKLHELAA
jgi:uncharacterized protein (DUF2336 family)